MSEDINTKVNEETLKRLEEIAENNGLSLQVLCQIVLQEFIGDGNVHWGDWTKGPGRRFIIDWPKFSSRVLKIKSEDMK